jgi:UDP-N-acetylmuramate dehydrogenase
MNKIDKNISLKNYTTFKIGGNARFFLKAENLEDLIYGINFSEQSKIPFFILGNGSNLLISDKGFNGIVIKISNKETIFKENKIIVDAGVPLPLLIASSFKNGLSGLEWAAGIPGSIGGAIRGNAGAFGSFMADIIKEVEVFDVNDKKIKKISKDGGSFNYRESVFKKNDNLIILKAEIVLKKDKKSAIERKIKGYLDYRNERHPKEFSAGSVFKNYKISNNKEKKEILRKIHGIDKIIKNNIIPSGLIVEKCGLKGKKIGGAMISNVHSNFIVNIRNATSEDVRSLIILVKKRVKERLNIELQEEIQYLGFKN